MFCSGTLNLMQFLLLRWSFFWGLWACSSVFNHCWQPPVPSGHSVYVCVGLNETEREREEETSFILLSFTYVSRQVLLVWCVCFVCMRETPEKIIQCFSCVFVCGVLSLCVHCEPFFSLSLSLSPKSTATHSSVSSVSQKTFQPYDLINLPFHFKTFFFF